MTSAISSGTISSTGIGSGLDVNSIISKTMQIENLPLTQLQAKATNIRTTISAFGAVQSALSTFRDAARGLTNPSTWSAVTATSADPTSVSVGTSAGAVAGSYAIKVISLAAAQSTVSGTFGSSSELVGAGTLHIDLAGATGFANPSTTGFDITTTASDTLATLNDKINAAGGGVASSIVTDATGSRLVMSSSTTGTANAFRASGTGGLTNFSFDPGASSPGATTLTQGALNASATINGLPVTSATNTLSNVLQGLTVNLTKASTTPVQINVAPNTDSMKTAVNTFVTAYNALATLIAADVRYDAATQTAGPLQADSTAVSLQRQLRNILGSSSTASTAFTTLSQAGIESQADGTLKVNDAKLSNAVANQTELKAMFMAVSTTDPSANGFAQQFKSLSDSALNTNGLLSSRVAGLNSSLTRNQSDQGTMTDRLAKVEARLRAQYSALDTKMASISALSTYVTQQIANWNKNN